MVLQSWKNAHRTKKKKNLIYCAKKYLFLFLHVIKGKCPKYWLNFYFKPKKKTKKQKQNIQPFSNMHSILKKLIKEKKTKQHEVINLLYSKCYWLQRQTLDHDPLARMFLGLFRGSASLYCFILPDRQQSHVQHTLPSITFTQMSWQRSNRESKGV